MKNRPELPGRDSLAHTAELVVSNWLISSATDTPADTCLALSMLESYRMGRLAVEEQAQVQQHVLVCASCAEILACLHRAQTTEGDRILWRTEALEPLLALHSEWAQEQRDHIGAWLASLKTEGSGAPGLNSLEVPLETPNGDDFLIHVQPLSPSIVDAQGRLVVALALDTPPRMPVQLNLSLATPTARLELFTASTEEPYFEAIVDLSRYVSGPISLTAECIAIRIAAEDVPVLTATPLTLQFERLTAPARIDLAVVDAMLGSAAAGQLSIEAFQRDIATSVCRERTIAAIARAADLQSRYVKMWRTGNSGSIPEDAVMLLTEMACALEELSVEVRQAALTLEYSSSILSSLNSDASPLVRHALSNLPV